MCQTSRDAGLHLDTITDFARSWWSDDRFRLLPGEEDDHTVFVIDFYDRCKYFGYTRDLVFYRAAVFGRPHSRLATRHLRHGTRSACPVHHPLHQIRPQRPEGQAAPEHVSSPGTAEPARSPRQLRPDAQLLAFGTQRPASASNRPGDPAEMKSPVKPHAKQVQVHLWSSPQSPLDKLR